MKGKKSGMNGWIDHYDWEDRHVLNRGHIIQYLSNGFIAQFEIGRY